MPLITDLQKLFQNIGFQKAGGITQGSLTPIGRYTPSTYLTASPSGRPASSYITPAKVQTWTGASPVTTPPTTNPRIGLENPGNPVSPIQAATSPNLTPILEPLPASNPSEGFEKNYGSFFDSYLSDLNSREAARKQSYENDLTLIESQKGLQQKQIQSDLETTKADLASQEKKAAALSEENVNQQRRAYSEMAQGLQSAYGGTTGTGAFATELMGREVLGNIGKIRQNFSSAVEDLGLTRAKAISEANQRIDQSNYLAAQLTSQARTQLNADLEQIANARYMSQRDRMDRKMQAYQNYQNLVGDINARNSSFRQSIYRQQKDFEDKMNAQKLVTYTSYVDQLLGQLPDFMNLSKYLPAYDVSATVPYGSQGRISIKPKTKKSEGENNITNDEALKRALGL